MSQKTVNALPTNSENSFKKVDITNLN